MNDEEFRERAKAKAILAQHQAAACHRSASRAISISSAVFWQDSAAWWHRRAASFVSDLLESDR